MRVTGHFLVSAYAGLELHELDLDFSILFVDILVHFLELLENYFELLPLVVGFLLFNFLKPHSDLKRVEFLREQSKLDLIAVNHLLGFLIHLKYNVS